MLETLGHLVFEATSAEEALSVLEQEDVDVLMTDHGLPGISGAGLAVACSESAPTTGAGDCVLFGDYRHSAG